MANAGTQVASGLTMSSKALQKLDKGGVTAPSGTKSIAGRSMRSTGTKRTGTKSQVGSRKSKADNDLAEMEIEEIEAIIEEKEREMKSINNEKRKIQKNKSMN